MMIQSNETDHPSFQSFGDPSWGRLFCFGSGVFEVIGALPLWILSGEQSPFVGGCRPDWFTPFPAPGNPLEKGVKNKRFWAPKKAPFGVF